MTVIMVPNLKCGNSTALENNKALQKIIDEMSHLAAITRPDVSYSVHRVATMASEGTKEVFQATKRILCNLESTKALESTIANYILEK